MSDARDAIVMPTGVTPGGLPYPEDTDLVRQGAQAIKALAQAVDGRVTGNPVAVYDALRALGSAQVPITWSYDPAFGGGVHAYPATSGRLQMVALTVPHVYTCTGLGMVTDTVGTNYPGTVYNGVGLWQYAANGDATFLRDSGATDGSMWVAAGPWSRPWNQGPIQLVPGVVYLAGFQHQSNGGVNAVIRGISGGQPNIGIPSNALFGRSVGVAAPGATRAAVMKTWPAASLVPYANFPLVVLY